MAIGDGNDIQASPLREAFGPAAAMKLDNPNSIMLTGPQQQLPSSQSSYDVADARIVTPSQAVPAGFLGLPATAENAQAALAAGNRGASGGMIGLSGSIQKIALRPGG